MAERKPHVVRFWVGEDLYDYDTQLTEDEARVVRNHLSKLDDAYDIQVFEWGGNPIVGAGAMIEEIDSLFDVDEEDKDATA